MSCRNNKATVYVFSTVTPTISYQSTDIKIDIVQFSCVLKLDKICIFGLPNLVTNKMIWIDI